MQTAIQQQILNNNPQMKHKDVFIKFCLYFITGLLFFGLLLSAIVRIEYQQALAVQSKEQVNKLEFVHYMVQHDLEMLTSDLLVLANDNILKQYLKEQSETAREGLENRYLVFARDRKIYNQVRFLDLNGEEIVRVNMGKQPEIIKKNKLQNKKDRYYFSETLHYNKNNIYVSPLDLNVENKQIQSPFTPVIRVGSPVFDEDNKVRGVVVINFNAYHILNHYFHAYTPDQKSEFSIVNKAGFWLKASDPALEWGFMFGKDIRLQNIEPELWADIKRQKDGQVHLSSGLFTFKTLYPDQIIRSGISIAPSSSDGGHSNTDDRKPEWHFILKIPQYKLTYMYFLNQHSELFWLLPVLLAVLVWSALYLAIVRVRKLLFNRTLTLLSTSIEQSPAAVLITDVSGKIKYANPKFEKMSGYSRTDVVGENPRIFKSGKTSNEIYDALWKTVLKGRVWKGDFENKHKNGSSYYVSAQIAPLVDGKNRIDSLLAIQEDVTEKIALQKQLEEMATRDSLTGSLNRGQFLHLSNKELQKVQRYQTNASVILFDLDFFKTVNDTYGHHAGDLVLQEFVNCIQCGLRDSDLLGRLGGEEFAALVLGGDRESVFQLAERLRFATEEMSIEYVQNTIKVTVSIGYTLLKESDREIDDALKRSDDALYLAKENGRNRTEFV